MIHFTHPAQKIDQVDSKNKDMGQTFINTGSFRNPSYEGHPHMRDSFPSYEVPFFQNFEFVKLFLSSKFKLH